MDIPACTLTHFVFQREWSTFLTFLRISLQIQAFSPYYPTILRLHTSTPTNVPTFQKNVRTNSECDDCGTAVSLSSPANEIDIPASAPAALCTWLGGKPGDRQAIVSWGHDKGRRFDSRPPILYDPNLYLIFWCKHLLFPLLSHTWRDWKVLRGCWWRNAINFFRPSPAHRALQTAAAFLAFLSTSQDAFSSTNNSCSIVSEFLLPITKCNRTALCITGCLGFSPYLVRLKCIFSNDHWSPDTWILCPINFLHWDLN